MSLSDWWNNYTASGFIGLLCLAAAMVVAFCLYPVYVKIAEWWDDRQWRRRQ